ncbi:MAG: cation transporter [Ruminococcus sp.]|nr:cation transporter [Ruminococcus sp.]
MNREKIIVRTSVIGILANIFLAAFKAAVGLLSNSISVVLDAVNNLSDALSSVITIIGTKLSSKPADKKHPLGHGRAEYLTAMLIAALVLYAGITSLIESVKKIITPETPDYSTVSLIIISVAVVVKIVLGLYVSKTGKKVNSDSLKNSGKDALLDAVISTSVLLAAVIFLIWHISLEAYLGAIISLVIIKSGIDMFRETISEILGKRIDAELSKQIKEDVCSFEEVKGAYDLVLHSYGPDNLIGSVHIEIPDEMRAYEIDALERKIQTQIYEKHGVVLAGISVYSVNSMDEETRNLYASVSDIVMSFDNVLQMHGFYLDKETKTVRFDIIISFDEKNRKALFEEIIKMVSTMHPEYTFCPILDSDISD